MLPFILLFTVCLMNSPAWEIELFVVASLIHSLYYCLFVSLVTKGFLWHKDVNSGLPIMKDRETVWTCV